MLRLRAHLFVRDGRAPDLARQCGREALSDRGTPPVPAWNEAVTSTKRPSGETAARGWTTAIEGSRRSCVAAAAACAGVATTRIDGPGTTPRQARELLQRPEALGRRVLEVVVARAEVACRRGAEDGRDDRERHGDREDRAGTACSEIGERLEYQRQRRPSETAAASAQCMEMKLLDLFPDTASVEGGELWLGGARATDLAREFGTPVVVYDEQTLRNQARAYLKAAPGALVAYGTKAFPSIAVSQIFAEEGLGADVSTVGELEFALRAGMTGERLVIHGNNKEDELLERSIEVGALIVLDSLDELERVQTAGGTRFLVRVTPGIEADTHEAIKTAHHGSKFGLPPDDAVEAIRRAPGAAGLHVHVGSQLMHFGAALMTVDWIAQFAARLRADFDWTPRVVDLGGGLGARHVLEEPAFTVDEFVRGMVGELQRAFHLQGLPPAELILEPGRSLVSRAGVTLYTVGDVKRASAATTYVTVDGGMSDNPRPAMYNARYAAVLANRADGEAAEAYTVAGKHCESGDVLIERVELPAPQRGDVLAVPVTGAYTLAMASTYNAVPRPAAVLVSDGNARVIRRRETVDDLLALEEPLRHVRERPCPARFVHVSPVMRDLHVKPR